MDGQALHRGIFCDSDTDRLSANLPFHRTRESMPFDGHYQKTGFTHTSARYFAFIHAKQSACCCAFSAGLGYPVGCGDMCLLCADFLLPNEKTQTTRGLSGGRKMRIPAQISG